MAKSKGKRDAAREEFLSEAQELIEALSRDLLVLDQAQKEGRVEPDTLNDLFRGVHTLKGLAGMFGFERLSGLAHQLEELLEKLRLGRIKLEGKTLDVLFEGIDHFQRLLAEATNDEPVDIDLDALSRSIDALTAAEEQSRNVFDEYAIDTSILAVLTEYEEHRLRTNLEQGVPVYRVGIRLVLDVIDTALEELKGRAKRVAEIITYLPSMGASGGDTIDIEVLLASKASEAKLREIVNRSDATFHQIERILDPAEEQGGGQELSAEAQQPKASEEAASDGDRDKEAFDEMSLRSVTNTVRVDIRKLDYLMNMVGELGVVRSALARGVEQLRAMPEMSKLASDLHRVHRTFERHLTEVQDGVLDVRMVPLRQVFDKLGRIVRQVARDFGKDVRLVVTGADTEVDKLIAEELADPLMHIVRNAVDHGLEPPEQRNKNDKPETGTLAINAYQKGNHVVIEVQDDGHGIDPGKLAEAAVRKDLLAEDAVSELSREELFDIIFLPGFSTASAVTDISGRGVGMDVVKTNITRIGGLIDVDSELGVGTKFTITLPITLAIIRALIVEVGGKNFAMPLATIQEAIKLDRTAVRTVEGREVLTVRGTTLPVLKLGELFGLKRPEVVHAKQFVVVAVLGHRRLGFVVDRLFGQQDVVIKSLGRSLQGVKGIAGATDLGDQRLVLVLDAPALLEESLKSGEAALLGAVS